MKRALVLATALVALTSRAGSAEPPVRVLLSLGSDVGDPEEPPLQHAEHDAQRVRSVFVELGGVDSSRALVLTRATANKVTERLAELQGRIAELKAAGRRVELFVFASAHGRGGELHLTGTHLPLASLRELTRACAADLTITVVDACESGGAREKGAAKGPAYALTVQPVGATGEVFISSSGASESAQEWDVLSGSLFTHHLLSGLRGDADADDDGRVSLMESYAYAQRRTVANSVDRGQHPEFAVALRGASDVVLTELDRGKARVVLDETFEGRFVLVSQPRPDVVTEVVKARGKVLSLAVPPGRYLLRHAQGFSVALQEVELPWGGVTRVDAKRFVVRDFSEVALKGGDVEFHPHSLELMGGVTSPTIANTPVRPLAGLGYRFTAGNWWLGVAVAWSTASFRGYELSTRDDRFALRTATGFRWWLGSLLVMPGLAVETGLVRQQSRRDNEAEITRVYPALPVRLTPAISVGPQLRVEIPIEAAFYVRVATTGWVRWLEQVEGPAWTLGVDGEVAVGLRW